MPTLDWSQCPAVESIPGKRSGAWVFRTLGCPWLRFLKILRQVRDVYKRQEHDVVHIAAHDSRRLRPGEITGHGRIGSEQEVIIRAAIVGILRLLFEHTDYSVGNALNLQIRTHGGFAAEQLLAGGIAEDNHAAAFCLIFFRHQPAFAEVQRTKILERWPHSHDFAVCGVELADLGNRASQLRAHILYEVALVADQTSVVHRQRDFASRCQPADLRTGSSTPDDDQILSLIHISRHAGRGSATGVS